MSGWEWGGVDFGVGVGVSGEDSLGILGAGDSGAFGSKLTWSQPWFPNVHLEADILLVAALLQNKDFDDFPAMD